MASVEVTGVALVNREEVLDLEITPNRADCLSIVGLAREVSAILGEPFKLRAVQGSGLGAQGKSRKPPAQSPQHRATLLIRIDDRKGCTRYIGRLIDDVRVGPSPDC